MVEVRYERGIFIPAADFWLDPYGRKPFAFVSHAHSDHTGAHGRIVATPATALLTSSRSRIPRETFLELPFGERREFGAFAATLIPAGHVLGSAQIHLECEGGDLLYTGDFKLRSGLSSEVAGSVNAETLVMETTYGLPKYRFPPTEEVLAAVVQFCAEVLEDGDVPVLLGYSLGKAQEILASLSGSGFSVMLHGSIAKMAEIYESFGVQFPEFVGWDASAADGHVVICPPAAAGSRTLTSIKKRRLAAVTGWALDAGAIYRMGVEVAFPLSDHADYPDLLAHVGEVNPSRVLTVHGFAQEFARDLRARGIEAWALTGPNQLEWDTLVPPPPPQRPPGMPALRAGGFEAFATVCENIRKTTGKIRKVGLLSNYLRGLRNHELRNVATWLTGRAFAPAEGLSLNVGWAILRRALAQAAKMPEAEIRAVARRINDPGLTVAEVLARFQGPFASHSLPQVAATFAAIASKGGPLAKTEALAGVLREMHPLAAGMLVRIVTGDLRIGLKEGLVEEAIAQAFSADPDLVREANMLTGDPGQTAVLASDGKLAEAKMILFRPIKCMLASPEPDASSIWERLAAGGSVWLEQKMDGIRAQVHARPGQAEIFSRDLRRITGSFPEIASAAASLGRQVVLDGEILAIEGGRPLPFFELQKRLGRNDGDLFLPHRIPAAFFAFDLLAFEGSTLLRKPLKERREILARLALPEPLSIVPVNQASCVEEIDAAFDQARADGHEGLLAKNPLSFYAPGRRGMAWLKLKKAFARKLLARVT